MFSLTDTKYLAKAVRKWNAVNREYIPKGTDFSPLENEWKTPVFHFNMDLKKDLIKQHKGVKNLTWLRHDWMTGLENNCWNPNMKLNRAEANSVRITKPKANRDICSVMILHEKRLKHECHFSLQDSGSWTPSRIQLCSKLPLCLVPDVAKGLHHNAGCPGPGRLFTLVPSPCMPCAHTARENKNLWPSMRVHRAEQQRRSTQEATQLSASTCWIALKDSSSFKTDGTYSQSAIQPTAGFPFCFDPSVVWLLMNKSEDSSLPEAFWARAKTEPEANVTHWPNSGIILYMLL